MSSLGVGKNTIDITGNPPSKRLKKRIRASAKSLNDYICLILDFLKIDISQAFSRYIGEFWANDAPKFVNSKNHLALRKFPKSWSWRPHTRGGDLFSDMAVRMFKSQKFKIFTISEFFKS